MSLAELPLRTPACVHGLTGDPRTDSLCRRLDVLGFVVGEPVQVSARGPMGGEPLLVDIGSTRFALRRAEAACVLVSTAAQAGTLGQASIAAQANIRMQAAA